MRIVAGQLKGRRLTAPDGRQTRPTSDRARQALFNILASAEALPIDGHVLDVFAGSGALGIEALSRGAARATFIEQDRLALRCLSDNLDRLGVAARSTVLAIDATRPGKATTPCDLVFLDPPYHSGLAAMALPALAAQGWLAAHGRIVIEVAVDEAFELSLPGWAIEDERRYGAARLLFIQPVP